MTTDRHSCVSSAAALIDGFDIVMMDTRRLRATDARRLVARIRERSSVLRAVAADLPGQPGPLHLTVTAGAWHGIGQGRGDLQGRRVTVEASGRGEAARPRRAELWLPSPTGALESIEPVAEPVLAAPTTGRPAPLRPDQTHLERRRTDPPRVAPGQAGSAVSLGQPTRRPATRRAVAHTLPPSLNMLLMTSDGMTSDGEWLSTNQVAWQLGIVPRTVYRLIDRGELPAYRIGRVIRVRASDADAYVARQRVKPGSLGHLHEFPARDHDCHDSDPRE